MFYLPFSLKFQQIIEENGICITLASERFVFFPQSEVFTGLVPTYGSGNTRRVEECQIVCVCVGGGTLFDTE